MPDPSPKRIFDTRLCDPGQRHWILIVAAIASAMGFIDSSLVAIAMPSIRNSLGATLVESQWVSNAYMLTLASFILVGGAIGDRLGLVKVFKLGILVFVVASVACAIAPSPNALIAARFVKGVGAAMMVPGSMAIVSRAYPREERGRALGIWAATSSITTGLGPILGGLALSVWGEDVWRWLFAINLPLGILCLIVLNRVVQHDASKPGTPIDIAGGVFATLGLGILAFGLTQLQSPEIAVSASMMGLCLIGVFIWWEAKIDTPMLPLKLFKEPGFSAINLATFLLWTAFSSILFFLPMMVVAGWGISEFAMTAAFFPLTIFIGGLSTWSGKMADKVGAGPMIGSGATIVAIALILLGYTAPEMNYWGRTVPSMALMAFGMSLVVSPLTAGVMAAAPDHMSGTASGVNNAVARTAGLFAVAAFGGIAGMAYSAFGGGESFGIQSSTDGHLTAVNLAFRTITFGAAFLALTSAIVGFFAVPKPKV